MKNKNREGYTKQGLRDLNHLPTKPRGRRIELPPSMMERPCNHPQFAVRVDADGDQFCQRCKTFVN